MKKFYNENHYIPFKSLSIAWIFTTVSLFLWTGYKFAIEGDYIPPLILLMLMNIVLFTSQYILTKKYSNHK
ncbi:MAG: hypothetical protein RR838_10405 [Clostridium sp.]